MKKTLNQEFLIREAANRIKEIITQKKGDLFVLPTSKKDSHYGTCFKFPRLPYQTGKLPSPMEFSTQKKKVFCLLSNAIQIFLDRLTKEGDLPKEAIHTHEWCTSHKRFLQHLIQKERKLAKRSVHRWTLKVRTYVDKQLKHFSQIVDAESFHHKITLLSQKAIDDEKEERKQKELWEDFIRVKEERQFTLTRITKYLSD